MQLIGVINIKNGSITIDPPYFGLPAGPTNQPTEKCPDWELFDPAKQVNEKCPALKINELKLSDPANFTNWEMSGLRNVWLPYFIYRVSWPKMGWVDSGMRWFCVLVGSASESSLYSSLNGYKANKVATVINSWRRKYTWHFKVEWNFFH